jgi:Uma2 family endonuclease
MAEHAAVGVRYYWLLDPALGSLEIFELTGQARYARAAAATAGKLTGIPGCDDLTVDLDELWSELDRLAPEE